MGGLGTRPRQFTRTRIFLIKLPVMFTSRPGSGHGFMLHSTTMGSMIIILCVGCRVTPFQGSGYTRHVVGTVFCPPPDREDKLESVRPIVFACWSLELAPLEMVSLRSKYNRERYGVRCLVVGRKILGQPCSLGVVKGFGPKYTFLGRCCQCKR